MDEGVLKNVVFSDQNTKPKESCNESSHALWSRKKRKRENSENLEEPQRGKSLKALNKLTKVGKCQKPARMQVIS